MRTFLLGLFLSFSVILKAQSVENMMSVFPETFDQFEPEGIFNAKELKDGTLRVSRKFVDGERTLTVRLSASSEANLDENLAAIGELINSLEELSTQGIMTMERDQGELYSGIFTFIAREQKVAGGLFLVRDRYMLEIEIVGGENIEEAKEVFALIDLVRLN